MIEGRYMNILEWFEPEAFDELTYEKSEQCYYTKQYPLLIGFEEYNTKDVYASTLDGYLMLLVRGYINVRLRAGLEMHLMDLLEDEWFYQWPLVHWVYGSNLLRGVGCKKDIKSAVDILLPMAREGCPGALYDIGCCYMNGWGVEESYTKAIYCWLKAWEKGYHLAKEVLKPEYWSGSFKMHEEVPTDVKHAFIGQILHWFMVDRNLTDKNIDDKLDSLEKNEHRKLCNWAKRLEKELKQEEPLRMAAKLFYDDANNPYEVKI